MELWLDTIDRSAIEEARECGLLFGVTTNPSIVAKSQEPLEEMLESLLSLHSGPVAVQVTTRDSQEMIEQAKDLYDFSQRIIVKIPAIPEGIKAIFNLTHLGIPTMATAIFEPLQGFLAAKAGAAYAAPYVAHIGDKRLEVLQEFKNILTSYHLPTKILAAALKSPEQVLQCAQLGIAAVTLKETLFYECFKAPTQTLDYLAKFEEAWQTAHPSRLLPRTLNSPLY